MRKLSVALGLGCAAALVAALLGLFAFTRVVEMKAYDVRTRLVARPELARRDIVLVNIDEDSIDKLEPLVGRFPWPRLVHAQLVNFLARGPAAAVAYDVLFSERDRTSFTVQGETWTGAESDEALVEAVRQAGNVVLAADATREAEQPQPGGVAQAADHPAVRPRDVIPSFERVSPPFEPRPMLTLPFPELARAARAVGHSFLVLDDDGPARRSVPFIAVNGRPVPSLAVATALTAGRVSPEQVSSTRQALRLGAAVMPLVPATVKSVDGSAARASRRSLIRFAGPVTSGGRSTYEEHSFYRLFYSEQQVQGGVEPLVDPSRFRGKVVLVGVTAAGLHDTFAVPFEGKMPGSAIHANVVDNILSRRFVRPAPRWSAALAVAIAGVLVAAAGVLLGAWWTIAAVAAAFVSLAAASLALFARGTWLPVVQPAAAVILAAFGSLGYQYFVEGREKRQIKRVFSRLVAPDVYRHLLAHPARARLGGERREMSVLFADIRGFTTLTESGKAEEVVAQLNAYFSRMVEVIFAHRGTVDKFVGDMVMALFGAPVRDPRHADAALEAARHMVRALDELNARWEAEGRPRLDIGVGINSGEMIAGTIGSTQIMSYTVIGDAVNLASRVESLNKQYGTTILITEDTRRSLTGRFDLQPLGEVTVKGKTRAVAIYAVAPAEVVPTSGAKVGPGAAAAGRGEIE